MAIITKPGSITKGTPATFTLNKSELLAVASVQADAYFSNSSNWNRVSVIYNSNPGSQYEIVEFNATGASPTGVFSVSDKARDIFEVQSVIIIDFDGGIFTVPRSELNTADFDIDLNPTPPSTTYITWDQLEGGSQLPLGGYTGGERAHSVVNAPAVGQDFTLVFKIDTALVNGDYIVGTHVIGTSDTYSGFIMNGSPTSWNLYWEGQRHNSITVSSGIHEFKMQRVGTTISYYVDNSLIASRAATQPAEVQFVQNPVARVKGYTLSEAYISMQVSNLFNNSLKSSDITVSNNGLTVTRTSIAAPYVSAILDRTIMLSGSDKLYFEMTVNTGIPSSAAAMGFVLQTTIPSVFDSASITIEGGYTTNSGPRMVMQAGSIYLQSFSTGLQGIGGTGATLTTGTVWGLAIDVGAKTFEFIVDGVPKGSYSFNSILESADRLYIALGPYSIGDSYTKNTVSANTPVGYTLI
jgi:hypothetical protein